jgi:hypothetical protein
MGHNVQFSLYQYVVSISIAGQKIVKALTFNGQWIVGLWKSLALNTINFSKVGNGLCLTALNHYFNDVHIP